MFDDIWERSDLPIDSNTTDMFKVQKGRKDIVKIVHVTSVVDIKIMTLFNHVTILHHSWKYHDALLYMQGHKALYFLINILICVPKMNKGFTGLERHEGE